MNFWQELVNKYSKEEAIFFFSSPSGSMSFCLGVALKE